jgi:tetratricopeptide (TPR) repeat protein
MDNNRTAKIRTFFGIRKIFGLFFKNLLSLRCFINQKVMKKISYLLVLICATFFQAKAAPTDTLVFEATGEEIFTIAISTNAATWNIAQKVAWCRSEKKSDSQLTLQCEPNLSLSPRVDSIKINAEGAPIIIFIKQNEVANPYRMGEYFFNKDRVELARRCFQLGVDVGDAECQCRLGRMYFEEENFEKAKTLFTLSAEQGNPRGENNLGFLFENGFGLDEPNPKEAVRWYQKSADRGFAPAQYNLGRMYEKGNGVLGSVKDAMLWYEKASLQGHEEARARIRELSYRSNPWL